MQDKQERGTRSMARRSGVRAAALGVALLSVGLVVGSTAAQLRPRRVITPPALQLRSLNQRANPGVTVQVEAVPPSRDVTVAPTSFTEARFPSPETLAERLAVSPRSMRDRQQFGMNAGLSHTLSVGTAIQFYPFGRISGYAIEGRRYILFLEGERPEHHAGYLIEMMGLVRGNAYVFTCGAALTDAVEFGFFHDGAKTTVANDHNRNRDLQYVTYVYHHTSTETRTRLQLALVDDPDAHAGVGVMPIDPCEVQTYPIPR